MSKKHELPPNLSGLTGSPLLYLPTFHLTFHLGGGTDSPPRILSNSLASPRRRVKAGFTPLTELAEVLPYFSI